MKTTEAETHIEIICYCPYCNDRLDIESNGFITEALGSRHRLDDCEIENTCEECGETFLVTAIRY